MSNSTHDALRGLVHKSARFLDDCAFEDYTALYCDSGEYRIEVNAPECPSRMTWMLLNRDELATRFEEAASHKWKLAQQTRLLTVGFIEFGDDGATTSSTFCLYHTDGNGESSCYAVGRYEDQWSLVGEEWKLAKRVVNLATRMLSTSSPLPI
jgi:3-phenylpropionate/cinnamic acid dioxygenase small subunit